MIALTAPDLAQPVLAPPAKSAIFLTLQVKPGHAGQVRELLTQVAPLQRAVGFRVPEAGLSVVAGLGAELWDEAFTDLPRPAGLHRFRELHGAKHSAPSTPGDLFFHIRSARFDMCFDLAQQVMLTFGEHTDPVDEVHGFRSWDERDLLGFVDGTENPPFGYQANTSALLGDEDHYAGGSFVIIQKYLHNLTNWHAISVEEQERVIGRTKLEDIELPDSVKPTNSHVALNTIDDAEGKQQQIVRDNLPFGNASEGYFGTFFIGYAANPAVTEEMLTNMFIGRPPGNYDRILDFSDAVTGCLFFIPPAPFLDDVDSYLVSPNSDDEETPLQKAGEPPAPPSKPTAINGSLNIGSLKEK